MKRTVEQLAALGKICPRNAGPEIGEGQPAGMQNGATRPFVWIWW